MMIKYTIEYTEMTWNDYSKVNQHKIFKMLLRKVCFNVKETFTTVHKVQWGIEKVWGPWKRGSGWKHATVVHSWLKCWPALILHCCFWLGWLKWRWDLVFAIGFLRYWDGWSCQMTKRSYFWRHSVAELCVLDSWKFGQNIIETVTVFNGWCYT